ncbi:MAG: hypothetical protein KAQ84_00420 [Thermoplasmatales archaeon]|nr:hypothetical protein [Thermoplasmatales archaeon]
MSKIAKDKKKNTREKALERIRVGVMVSKESMKVCHVVEEMNAIEARLFNIFRKAQFVQK